MTTFRNSYGYQPFNRDGEEVLLGLGNLGEAGLRERIPHSLAHHVGADLALQILACAIVVTVSLGCIKLGYTHWRLRKYAAIEKEKKEQVMQRQMSQRERQTHDQRSTDVPFGIRAIESGIEIEGVWISRSNTPEPLSRNVSAETSVIERLPSDYSDLDVEKGRDTGPKRSAPNSHTGTVRPDYCSFDQAVSAEKLPSTSASRGLFHCQARPKPTSSVVLHSV